MGWRGTGYSLIEALVCVVVLAVAAGMAAPGLSGWLERQSTEAAAESLIRAVNFSRSLAVTSGAIVTFCRSTDGLHCGGGWEQGSIVFTDRNGDRVLDGEDRLARRLPALERSIGNPQVRIRFRSFPNRQYLQMTPRGFTRGQNGSFTICPPGGDARLAQQVVISRSGRARRAADRDGDGIREDSAGNALACP